MPRSQPHVVLSLVAVIVTVAAIIGGGLSAGQAATPTSFTASDYQWRVTGSSTDSSVTVAPGATVSFSYPAGSSAHNADFTGGPSPDSCTQSAGSSSGAVPPLPHSPTPAGWSGNCTFTTAGTYTFHCDAHPGSMNGTIIVSGPAPPSPSSSSSATSTASSPTSSATYPTATTPPTTPTGSLTGPATGRAPAHRSSRLALAAHQSGPRVRGSIAVAVAGSRLVVVVSETALTNARQRRPDRVLGQLVRRSLATGTVRFSVIISGSARRELRRHRRLVVLVTATLVTPNARSTLQSGQVTLTE